MSCYRALVMSEYLLIEGDQASFDPTFGAATVVVPPGELAGSGTATVLGKKVCIEGDEPDVSVPGCMYTTPVYTISSRARFEPLVYTGSGSFITSSIQPRAVTS